MSNNKDLKKLQKTWYEKLKKSGFDDIERNEEDLKVGSSSIFLKHKYTRDLWEAKAEYYRLAEHFLNEYRFATTLERVIWEYHTNAISTRNIAEILKRAKIKELSKSRIHTIIQTLARAMKARYLVNSKDKDGH